jgi:hypothetical protein
VVVLAHPDKYLVQAEVVALVVEQTETTAVLEDQQLLVKVLLVGLAVMVLVEINKVVVAVVLVLLVAMEEI